MNLILLAPPAAGKGTQAELLMEKYQLKQVCTGELFRAIAREDSVLGKEIKETLARGCLVEDSLVMEVLENFLSQNQQADNLIFDGFPRNQKQAELLDTMLREKNQQIDFVFYLNVPQDILLYRITGRKLCKSCGAIYNVNIDSLKPIKDSICDKCGGILYHRDDDNEDSFMIRYKNYLTETRPLIQYYHNQDKLYEIDSSVNKEYTFEQIESIIEKR